MGKKRYWLYQASLHGSWDLYALVWVWQGQLTALSRTRLFLPRW